MARFIVLENNIVENIIIADSLNDAELATGKTCIEQTPDNPAAIGFPYPIPDLEIESSN